MEDPSSSIYKESELESDGANTVVMQMNSKRMGSNHRQVTNESQAVSGFGEQRKGCIRLIGKDGI